MKTVIVDASVAMKWFVKDEENRSQALYLLKQFKLEEINFIIPDLLFYEVANAFKTFVRAKRITLTAGNKYIKRLLELNLLIVYSSTLIGPALKLAHKFDISVYDASYLALAKSQKIPFYSADEKLLNKIPSGFKYVNHLSSLKTDSN